MVENVGYRDFAQLSEAVSEFFELHGHDIYQNSPRRNADLNRLYYSIAFSACAEHGENILDYFESYPSFTQKKRNENHSTQQIIPTGALLIPRPTTPLFPKSESGDLEPHTPTPGWARTLLQQRPIPSFTDSEPRDSQPGTPTPDQVFDEAMLSSTQTTPGTDVDETDAMFSNMNLNDELPLTPINHAKPAATDDIHSSKSPTRRQNIGDIPADGRAAVLPTELPSLAQEIKKHNDHLSPRSKKNDVSYLDRLTQKLGIVEKKAGIVYLAVDTTDDELMGYVKIGVTASTTYERYKTDNCGRSHNMRFVVLEDNEEPYIGAARVERLLHLALYQERITIKCKFCHVTHKEWFDVDIYDALNLLRNCKALITASGFINDDGSMTRRARRAYDWSQSPFFTIECILRSFQLEAGPYRAFRAKDDAKRIAKAHYIVDRHQASSAGETHTSPLAAKSGPGTRAYNGGQEGEYNRDTDEDSSATFPNASRSLKTAFTEDSQRWA